MATAGSGIMRNASAVKAHLLQGSGGLGPEIADLRRDVVSAVTSLAAIGVDEFIDAAAGAAADLEAATATLAVGAVRTVTTFLAPGIAKLTANPRNLIFTTAGVTPANAPATVTINGLYRGKVQTETLALAQTAAVATGLKPFSSLTSIVYAASDGAAATISIGVGPSLGLSQKPKVRQALFYIVREIAIGAVVTTGTVTAEGLYTPAAAPNGTNDYTVYYEYSADL